MRALVTDSARRRLSPNGCGPKPSNLYYLLVKLCLGTQPRPIDFCCYIWGQRNFRPILMVSINVNMEHSMFMFARDSRPYGSIFQHDIENSMQAQVMSPKNNFNNMNFGFFLFKLMFKLSVLCICITSSYIHEYLNFPANYLNSLLTLQRQFILCRRSRVPLSNDKEGNSHEHEYEKKSPCSC